MQMIVCDDIRFEITGKEMLIGVYLDSVLLNAVPYAFKSLFVRLLVDTYGREYKNLTFNVNRPSGDELIRVEGTVAGGTVPAGEPTRFLFDLRGAVFPDMGLYPVRFGLDGIVREVGRIKLRLPENEEERARIL